ncbi:MAG: hypothetical protein OH319_02545 [Candidatus Parvarchaeota archaeon]|nr:hypothetical protein [Candidatus Jingweiarchaeum tengchongense]MCW1298248.1 hypothetical protein [Candidatus Jingweiarchaeum tengchongense]MCW1300045.1 hypothetical protein [Candidatus Jingweiarchaeum tengchongense]MCW1304816.1 hypothetical protein [Candidatus Jingweiarchaeum tengchongense]MCW1305406.1 hypothetical protein [Candidatus Jingweiarchaeum tengchongense]
MAEDILRSYGTFLDSVKRNLPNVEFELAQEVAYFSYFNAQPLPKGKVLIVYDKNVDLEKKAKGLLELSGEVEFNMDSKTSKILSIDMPLDLELLIKIASDKDIISINKSQELKLLSL